MYDIVGPGGLYTARHYIDELLEASSLHLGRLTRHFIAACPPLDHHRHHHHHHHHQQGMATGEAGGLDMLGATLLFQSLYRDASRARSVKAVRGEIEAAMGLKGDCNGYGVYNVSLGEAITLYATNPNWDPCMWGTGGPSPHHDAIMGIVAAEGEARSGAVARQEAAAYGATWEALEGEARLVYRLVAALPRPDRGEPNGG